MHNVVTLFYFTAWTFSYTDWFSLKSILFNFFLLDCNQRYQREWEYCKPSQPDCLLWHHSCSELIFSVWYLSGFPSNTVSVNTWYIFNKCWRKMHKVKTFCHLWTVLIFCTFLLTLSFLVWSWWFQGTLVYSTLFISMTKSLVSKVFSLHPLIYCHSFQHSFKRKTTQTMPSLSL